MLRGLTNSGSWTLIVFRLCQGYMLRGLENSGNCTLIVFRLCQGHMLRGLENSGNCTLIVFRLCQGHMLRGLENSGNRTLIVFRLCQVHMLRGLEHSGNWTLIEFRLCQDQRSSLYAARVGKFVKMVVLWQYDTKVGYGVQKFFRGCAAGGGSKNEAKSFISIFDGFPKYDSHKELDDDSDTSYYTRVMRGSYADQLELNDNDT